MFLVFLSSPFQVLRTKPHEIILLVVIIENDIFKHFKSPGRRDYHLPALKQLQTALLSWGELGSEIDEGQKRISKSDFKI
jgi:hypothetical protein